MKKTNFLLRRCLFFGILALCVALAAFGIWQMREGYNARSKLAAIEASGLPTTPQGVNEFYDSLCKKPDVTDDWLKLFALVQDKQFQSEVYEFVLFPPGEDWPQQDSVREFLDRNREKLVAIKTTLQKDGGVRFPIDYRDVLKLDMSHHENLRTLARLLLVDAELQAHLGNDEGFAESLEGILEIAGRHSELTMLGALLRISTRHRAVESVQRSLSRIEITSAVAHRLRTRFGQPINYLKSLQKGLIGERAISLGRFSDYETSLRGKGKNISWRSAFANSDRCCYLDAMQMAIDVCDSPLPDALDAAGNCNRFVDTFKTKRPRPILTMVLMPHVPAGVYAMCRQTFFDRACYVALAIEEYRADKGHVPESLNMLVPNFLKEVPQDPFDGQPIRFELTDIGYKLYSGSKNPFVFEIPKPFKLVSDGDLTRPSKNFSGVWEVVSSRGRQRYKATFNKGQVVGNESFNADD